MATNIISARATQFPYFDQVLGRPDWTGRRVLDFGGNIGGFLNGAGGRVRQEDYWCLDLNRVVVELGAGYFPRAHFVHYDRYSSQYNPAGVRHLPVPDLGLKFDFVLAFSVFTHTHRDEMVELVGQLRASLAPGGALAFTFCDPSYDRSLTAPHLPAGSDVRKVLEWQRADHPALEIEPLVEAAVRARWCLVVDEKLHVEPGAELSNQEHRGRPWESYCSYFSVEYVRSLFPGAEIHPPVSPEWQHCCVIREAP
jgi:SAM-dependent methyltransferase